ncbi:MAG: cobalt-precorrin 5A hydrolase [Pyramidobacter sp.]|nr:cobalt-precorrin 5A hydrolase [Pyramidobacter sp.]
MSALCVAAFTRDGAALALRIARELGGEAWASARYAGNGVLPMEGTVSDWARQRFLPGNELVFVSACGIAVRAVAPLVKSKQSDPAVVCLDDQGQFVISLLSGHLGGANQLARRIAAVTGGMPVVTTATDVHGKTAVDEWAKEHDCAIENIGAVKRISSSVLDGERVGVAVTDQLAPAPWPVTLWLRPRVLVLGVGCKRGTTMDILKSSLDDFLAGAGVSPLSLCAVASIDLKKDEAGLIGLADSLGVPFVTYSAAELAATAGRFTPSERVKSVTGVDNVCERAAVRCSGGALVRSKTLYPGVTMALARKPYHE